MEAVLIFAACSLVIVGMVVLIIQLQRRQVAKTLSAYEKIAQRFDGRAELIRGGFWKGNKIEARMIVEGVPLQLDYYVIRSQNSSTTYTRVRSMVENSPKVDIYEEGFFTKIGKALGMQDITTGDENYDSVFIVRSDEPETLVAAWDDEVRQRHLATQKARVRIEKGEVAVVRGGLLLKSDDLVPLLQLCSSAVRCFEPESRTG